MEEEEGVLEELRDLKEEVRAKEVPRESYDDAERNECRREERRRKEDGGEQGRE